VGGDTEKAHRPRGRAGALFVKGKGGRRGASAAPPPGCATLPQQTPPSAPVSPEPGRRPAQRPAPAPSPHPGRTQVSRNGPGLAGVLLCPSGHRHTTESKAR
jgi:hypothetical protein